MTSMILEGDYNNVLVILTCIDAHEKAESDYNHDANEVMISTSDVDSWNFSSILKYRIIKVQAYKNRLMEQSSYFNGLLGGNFSDSYLEVLVEWNQLTFLSLLTSLFGTPVEVTSENVLSLLEGALFFGMEIVLLNCKTWLTRAMTVNGVPGVELIFLVSIWKFGCEQMSEYIPELCASYLARNFTWAISCSCFGDVPHELLLSGIKHSHLTVESEKQVCDALLGWIAVNKEQCTKDACIDLLKQIRIGLLPQSFAAAKSTYQSLCMCFNKSFIGVTTLVKETSTCDMDTPGGTDLLDLRIRLSEFTQKVDLSGCPQIQPAILFLSTHPCSHSSEPLLRKKVKQLLVSHERHGDKAFQISPGMWPNLTFEAVREIDISNCPMLHLEVARDFFSKAFPSLRTLKAANHLSFRTTKLWDLMESCPLLCDIDLSVDVSPVIPSQVSILTRFLAITLKTSSPYFELPGPRLSEDSGPLSNMPIPLRFNLTKLTLDGRIDINDSDLQRISDICVSVTYLSLKGCISFSDVGMSRLIWKCVNLNSLVACDTLFGQESVQVICSSKARFGHVAPRSLGSNLQMLHIGGCKGINMTSFSELLSQASKLKSLCLRETEVVNDSLYKFLGSSLELLDVSNTKVSAAAVAHVVGRNPGLRCIKTRGCANSLQQENKTEGGKFSTGELYFELAKSCKLEEISAGWGFSCFSLEVLKPAVSLLKTIEVGLGGSLGLDGMKCLPVYCPLLESVVLYFQVISDQAIINMLESLRHLKSFALCHCLGETSSLSFKVNMPNLRKLRLERVAPWMDNVNLVSLSQNCVNLCELSLLGCKLLNSDSQKIISSGWPSLISIHLEECGDVTSNGVVSLLDCSALEDILLRHNGSGIQKDFICDAVSKLRMLRKISIDTCDAKDGDFDIPDFNGMRHFLSHVKIARCKPRVCALALRHFESPRTLVHSESLVLARDSKQLTRILVKERV